MFETTKYAQRNCDSETDYTKSGTSIGANYRKANHARCNADFKNNIKICESEASETQYWLEVVVEEEKMMSWEQVKADYEECSELLAVFLPFQSNFSSL